MKITAIATCAAAASAALALPVAAEEPVSTLSAPHDKRLGLGIEVGEPTSVTIRWVLPGGRLAANAGVGTGTFTGTGLYAHADVTWTPVVIGADSVFPLHLYGGAGVRYYDHHYRPASLDELPDKHVGVRMPLGVATRPTRSLEAYIELSPGYDVMRTESCSLLSGARSICPHTGSERWFIDTALGVRLYL